MLCQLRQAKRFIIDTHREEVKFIEKIGRIVVIQQVVSSGTEVGQSRQKNESGQLHVVSRRKARPESLLVSKNSRITFTRERDSRQHKT